MSICCAFSFSLIILFWFWFFFFPWAGAGEVCADVVNISIYNFFWKVFSRAVGFLLYLQSISVQGLPQVCVCIHCWRRTRPLTAPGALVQDALPFSWFIFGPRSLPAQIQLCVPTDARRTRALIPEEACVCLCVSVCARARALRGLFWIPRQDKEGCSAPLLQRLPARFRLWISSPSPFHLSHGPFLAVLIFTSL